MKIVIIVIFSFLTGWTWSQTDDINDFEQAILNHDVAGQKIIAKKIIHQKWTKNELLYYTQLLNQIPANAILLTNGIWDTYAVKCLQIESKMSPNVQLVSVRLLQDSSYYMSFFKKQGLKSVTYTANKTEYINQLIQCQKPLYISNTVPLIYLDQNIGQFYSIGLALEYQSSHQKVKLLQFWNQIKTYTPANLKLSASEKVLYQNIFPPLLTLYQLNVSEKEKKSIAEFIKNWAKDMEKESELNQLLNQYQ